MHSGNAAGQPGFAPAMRIAMFRSIKPAIAEIAAPVIDTGTGEATAFSSLSFWRSCKPQRDSGRVPSAGMILQGSFSSRGRSGNSC